MLPHAFPTSKHDAVYEIVCEMALFTMLFFYLNFFPLLIFIYLSANSYSNIDYYYAQNVKKKKITPILKLKISERQFVT